MNKVFFSQYFIKIDKIYLFLRQVIRFILSFVLRKDQFKCPQINLAISFILITTYFMYKYSYVRLINYEKINVLLYESNQNLVVQLLCGLEFCKMSKFMKTFLSSFKHVRIYNYGKSAFYN